MIGSLLALGYLPALVLTGWWIVSNPLKQSTGELGLTSKLGIAVAFGILCWFPILFACAFFNLFSPAAIGAAGWLGSVLLAIKTRGSSPIRFSPNNGKADQSVLVLAVAIFAFNGWFSAETILGGRDQGLYATHGAHIANTGKLRFDLPYERLFESQNFGIAGPTNPNGYFYDVDNGDIYLQFPPAFALNLAQFFGIGSYEALLLFNPLIGSINLMLFFGLCRLFINSRWALLAALFFALNTSQIWNARFTLSEMMAQNFILGGLATAVAAYRVRFRLGFVLGCGLASSAAFVRVDGFLLAAFIPIANVAMEIYTAKPTEDRKMLLAGSLASLATGILAYGYSMLSSPGYFGDFNDKVAILLVVAIAAITYSIFIASATFGERIHSFLKKPGFLYRCAVFLILLAIYGSFIRPHIEPFSQFDNPVYGTRDYRENSLVDLSKYISWPAILLALIGTSVAVVQFSKHRNIDLAIILMPWLGYSLVYLYDPQISADHIWRIRRFTPLSIPGFVFFAFWGLAFIANQLGSDQWKRLTYIASAIASTAFLLFTLRPIATLKEYDGSVETIRGISNSIPKGALTLANVSSEILGPLQLAEGHKMIRGEHADWAATNFNPIVRRIIEEEFESGRPIYILTELPQNGQGFLEPIGAWKHHIPRLKGVTSAPATESHVKKRNLFLGRMVRSIDKISATESFFTFGGARTWNVEETGLHGQEFNGLEPFRWTNGTAEFHIGYTLSRKPLSVIVDIFSTKPGGQTIQVYANDTLIFDQFVQENVKSLSIPLKSGLFKETQNSIRIVSDIWVHSNVDSQSNDERELGLAINRITLMFDETLKFGNAHFGNVPVRGIEESGLYPIENIDSQLMRWTNGNARYSLNLRDSYTPEKLILKIAGGFDQERRFEVKWNSKSLFSSLLDPNPQTLTIDLSSIPAGEGPVLLELLCDTFTPSELGISEDSRKLGLQVYGIEISNSGE